MSDHEEMTQKFSTFGDKLLQHCDTLNVLQKLGDIRPITVQLALTEVCDSDCPFCSVAARPLKSYLPWKDIEYLVLFFKRMGAKAFELTGGGNPLLYRDPIANKTINDVIALIAEQKMDVGIITNSHSLKNLLMRDKIKWVRISLIKLDEGKKPEDYDFDGFPPEKLGFSYIIYDTGGMTDELSRTKKAYKGTTQESIEKIAKLVELNPGIKFVRIAGNCLIKGNNQKIKEEYKSVIDSVDKYSKFFIKDIGTNDSPFNEGCYVGGIRPYIAPHPNGGDYQMYICTSHVLNTRKYDLKYSLGSIKDLDTIYWKMGRSIREKGYPYQINNNEGKNWCGECKFCYYRNNNKLLHTVVTKLPDKNFS